MKKDKAIQALREKSSRITYTFGKDNLPDVIRVYGYAEAGKEEPFIDIEMAQFKRTVLNLPEDEVFVIGRAQNADYRMCNYENNLFSRIHVVLLRNGNKVHLVDCSQNRATEAFFIKEAPESGLTPCKPLDCPTPWVIPGAHATYHAPKRKKNPWWKLW